MHPSELFNANRPPDVTKLGLDIESDHPKFEFDPKAELREDEWQDFEQYDLHFNPARHTLSSFLSNILTAYQVERNFNGFAEADEYIRTQFEKKPVSDIVDRLQFEVYKQVVDGQQVPSEEVMTEAVMNLKDLRFDNHPSGPKEKILFYCGLLGQPQTLDTDFSEDDRQTFEHFFRKGSMKEVDEFVTTFPEKLHIDTERFLWLVNEFRTRPKRVPERLGAFTITEAVHLQHIAQVLNAREKSRKAADTFEPMPETVNF